MTTLRHKLKPGRRRASKPPLHDKLESLLEGINPSSLSTTPSVSCPSAGPSRSTSTTATSAFSAAFPRSSSSFSLAPSKAPVSPPAPSDAFHSHLASLSPSPTLDFRLYAPALMSAGMSCEEELREISDLLGEEGFYTAVLEGAADAGVVVPPEQRRLLWRTLQASMRRE
ncbi:hypothetical protein JCM8547_005511 [Rhodosporidiobolus lusitaniae]